ncbi:MAG: SAM-dependent chlorinase/fluorinase [Bacteroidales bacterium]|nr:SAM-dependent chlorinase/fluorinase [Bacteroidales bacterium]
MAIITLLSDWGLKDHYTAMVKGKIISQIPGVSIVDISHEIPNFNLNSASFVLRNSYAHFPKGTFHIVDIHADATIEMPHVVALYKGHYFVGADNGLFSLVFDAAPEKVIEIDMIQDTDTFTFPTFDIFIKVVKHIVEGMALDAIGNVREKITDKISLKPVTSDELIKGHVIYIDNYENAITNISRELFYRIGQKRDFKIFFGASRYSVSKISHSYKDEPPGEILAFFNATGHLEIAISMGNAAGLLGLRIDDSVRVEFRG